MALHGCAAHARGWDTVAHGLAHRFQTVALDQRGHDRSWAADDDEQHVIADWAVPRAVNMVGYSGGGTLGSGPHPYRPDPSRPRRSYDEARSKGEGGEHWRSNHASRRPQADSRIPRRSGPCSRSLPRSFARSPIGDPWHGTAPKRVPVARWKQPQQSPLQSQMMDRYRCRPQADRFIAPARTPSSNPS